MNLSESAQGLTIHRGPGLAHAPWTHASLAGTQNCPVGGHNSHILIRNQKLKGMEKEWMKRTAIISSSSYLIHLSTVAEMKSKWETKALHRPLSIRLQYWFGLRSSVPSLSLTKRIHLALLIATIEKMEKRMKMERDSPAPCSGVRRGSDIRGRFRVKELIGEEELEGKGKEEGEGGEIRKKKGDKRSIEEGSSSSTTREIAMNGGSGGGRDDDDDDDDEERRRRRRMGRVDDPEEEEEDEEEEDEVNEVNEEKEETAGEGDRKGCYEDVIEAEKKEMDEWMKIDEEIVEYWIDEGKKEEMEKVYLKWTVEEDMKELNEKREKEGLPPLSLSEFTHERREKWLRMEWARERRGKSSNEEVKRRKRLEWEVEEEMRRERRDEAMKRLNEEEIIVEHFQYPHLSPIPPLPERMSSRSTHTMIVESIEAEVTRREEVNRLRMRDVILESYIKASVVIGEARRRGLRQRNWTMTEFIQSHRVDRLRVEESLLRVLEGMMRDEEEERQRLRWRVEEDMIEEERERDEEEEEEDERRNGGRLRGERMEGRMVDENEEMGVNEEEKEEEMEEEGEEHHRDEQKEEEAVPEAEAPPLPEASPYLGRYTLPIWPISPVRSSMHDENDGEWRMEIEDDSLFSHGFLEERLVTPSNQSTQSTHSTHSANENGEEKENTSHESVEKGENGDESAPSTHRSPTVLHLPPTVLHTSPTVPRPSPTVSNSDRSMDEEEEEEEETEVIRRMEETADLSLIDGMEGLDLMESTFHVDRRRDSTRDRSRSRSPHRSTPIERGHTPNEMHLIPPSNDEREEGDEREKRNERGMKRKRRNGEDGEEGESSATKYKRRRLSEDKNEGDEEREEKEMDEGEMKEEGREEEGQEGNEEIPHDRRLGESTLDGVREGEEREEIDVVTIEEGMEGRRERGEGMDENEVGEERENEEESGEREEERDGRGVEVIEGRKEGEERLDEGEKDDGEVEGEENEEEEDEERRDNNLYDELDGWEGMGGMEGDIGCHRCPQKDALISQLEKELALMRKERNSARFESIRISRWNGRLRMENMRLRGMIPLPAPIPPPLTPIPALRTRVLHKLDSYQPFELRGVKERFLDRAATTLVKRNRALLNYRQKDLVTLKGRIRAATPQQQQQPAYREALNEKKNKTAQLATTIDQWQRTNPGHVLDSSTIQLDVNGGLKTASHHTQEAKTRVIDLLSRLR